jgi:hypothetical protein
MNSTIHTRSVGYPLEVGQHQDVEQLGAGDLDRARPGARVAGARARRDARPRRLTPFRLSSSLAIWTNLKG